MPYTVCKRQKCWFEQQKSRVLPFQQFTWTPSLPGRPDQTLSINFLNDDTLMTFCRTLSLRVFPFVSVWPIVSRAVVSAFTVVWLFGNCVAIHQAASQSPDTPDSSPTQQAPTQQIPGSTLDEAGFKASVSRAIEMLGSSEFSARERAAEELMALGIKAVPALRELASHHDPEVRLRAADLEQQLTDGDFQIRVEAFLSGQDVHFDGWEYAQARLGMSPTIRELFVELTKRYPLLVESLEGTSRERAVALEDVVHKAQTALFIERRSPDPVDVIALLLPASDKDVPITSSFEKMVIVFLRREAGSRIRREQQLAAPVTSLIGDWVERSTETNRGEVIWVTMDWSIPEGRRLSLRTLNESNDPVLLALSMQAISRFGSLEDVTSVAKFLDDVRPVEENEFAIGDQPQALLSDVAMATIAILHKVPLGELGWEGVEPHPVFSFSPREIGFPPSQAELRANARKKIDSLLANPAPKS